MKVKKMRSIHKSLSLYFGAIILFYAISGILLNHRQLISNISISRKWLPANYQLHQWNQASIRGKIDLTPTERLIYGNIGVWKSDYNYQTFTDFNRGLPKGIDYRKVLSLIKTSNGQLFLGSEFGLYYFNDKQWKKLNLNLHSKRIYTLQEINHRLYFMNRSHLYSLPLENFINTPATKHKLIAPKDFKNELSLFRTLWFIHSGEIFGPYGKLFVDFLSLVMSFLILSGLFLVGYKFIKRKKIIPLKLTKTKTKIRDLHLKLGPTLAIFFIITAITGTFLRPPFLILINSISLPKIPGTYFYNDNPWFEKLRGFHYNAETNNFFLFTGDGSIYFAKGLSTELKKLSHTPPISIMGINHFSPLNDYEYLVGSFSGLHRWNLITGKIINHFTNRPYIQPKQPAPPVSDHLIAGVIKEQNQHYYFDFTTGSPNFNRGIMPQTIKEKYPMSLWNLALEVHTGRIFSQYLGPLFLLYVPFSGIVLTVILSFGLLLWYKAYRKRKK